MQTYNSIYITLVAPNTFKFEDGFGVNTATITATTVEAAITEFKTNYPITAERTFILK